MQGTGKREYVFSDQDKGNQIMLRNHQMFLQSFLSLDKIFWMRQDSNQINQTLFEALEKRFKIVKVKQVSELSLLCNKLVGGQKVILICSKQMKQIIFPNKKNEISNLIYKLIQFPSESKDEKFVVQGIQKHQYFTLYQNQTIKSIVQNFRTILKQKIEYKNKFTFISLNDDVERLNLLNRSIHGMLNLKELSQKDFIPEKFKAFRDYMSQIDPNLHPQQLFKQKDDENIIYLYTKNSSLINNILRYTSDPSYLFYIQPYFRQLYETVRKKLKELCQQKEIVQKGKIQMMLYRGGIATRQEIQSYKQNQGCYIQNICFLSTSKNKEKAKGFVSNIFYKIHVKVNLTDTKHSPGFAHITALSLYKSQEQFLFNPLSTFKIIKVQEKRGVVVVQLFYGDYEKLLGSKDIESREDRLNRFYFMKQLDQAKQIQSQANIIINQISLSKPGVRQYCERSYNNNIKKSASQESCQTANLFGILQRKSGQLLQAKQSYENSLKTAEILKIPQKCFQLKNDLGGIMIGLGKIQQALKFYKQARLILHQIKMDKNERQQKENFLDSNIILSKIRQINLNLYEIYNNILFGNDKGHIYQRSVIQEKFKLRQKKLQLKNQFKSLLEKIKKEQDYEFIYFPILLNELIYFQHKVSLKRLKELRMVANRLYGKSHEAYKFINSRINELSLINEQKEMKQTFKQNDKIKSYAHLY